MYYGVKYKCKTMNSLEKTVYYFNNDLDLDVKEGSHVLAATCNGYQYGVVVELEEKVPYVSPSQTIVALIDVHTYEEEAGKRETIKKIETEINRQIQAIKKRKELEQYAGVDPKIDALLKQLKELEQ